MSYSPLAIDGTERISRFGYDSGYYRNNGTAKTKAFVPDGNNEVSVFRIDDLAIPDIWALGDAARITPAKASIEIEASVVPKVGLLLSIAEPPQRHAVIVEWPAEHLRMQYQQQLAEASSVRFREKA